jgi:hypothetical protein
MVSSSHFSFPELPWGSLILIAQHHGPLAQHQQEDASPAYDIGGSTLLLTSNIRLLQHAALF